VAGLALVLGLLLAAVAVKVAMYPDAFPTS
jgi:hypothetical protein